MRSSDEEILEKLASVVDEKRYRHSILTAEKAASLASAHGLSSADAYTAGLCHDIAKRFSDEENREWAERYGLSSELLDERCKNYVHSDVGAVVAKEWFKVSDEISQAIAFHTIPSPSMTDFDKVVFLADKVGREDLPEELSGLYDLALSDLDAAMKHFLGLQEKDLISRGLSQHPRTAEFLKQLGGKF